MGCLAARQRVRSAVRDLFYIIVTVIFFYAGALFTRGCEKLAREEQGG